MVYEFEITILATQDTVSFPCYILPEDNSKPKILRTLEILNKFVKLSENEKIMDMSDNVGAKQH